LFIYRFSTRPNITVPVPILVPDYTLDLWLVNKDDEGLEECITQKRNWDGSGNIDSADADENSNIKNRRLLAARFQETDRVFYRPDCGIEKGDVPWDVESGSFIKGDKNGNSACNW